MEIGVIGTIGLIALAFVIGYIISYLTKEESGKAKRLYTLITGFAFLLTIIFPLFKVEKEMSSVVMLSLFFSGIVFLIMTIRAFRK